MNRRAFLATVGGWLLAAPLAADAQPPGKIWRVGWLQPSPPASAGHTNFRQAMGELGYVPGQSVAFEDRFADGDFGLLPGLAAELVRSKVDVIVAVAPGAIQAARTATRTIPIVMAFSGVDPVKAGFSRPRSTPRPAAPSRHSWCWGHRSSAALPPRRHTSWPRPASLRSPRGRNSRKRAVC